jgi:CTP:molybdopterin cytidylyltransferase MocA
MTEQPFPKYPVFIMCGEDAKRRKLMLEIDPEEKYKAKGLLPFLGKRLIDWPVDELRKSPYVDEIYFLGLSQEDLPFDFPVHYVPVETTSNVAEKMAAGLAYLQQQGKDPEMIVIATSDAPGIRQKEIDEFFESLNQRNGSEFVISLVPEAVAEEVFPKSGRVIARFRDCPVFPGELYALSPRAITIGQEAIDEFSNRRRQINRAKRKISLGPMIQYIAKRPQTWGFIIKYALKVAKLCDAEKAFSAAFDCKTKGVIISEAGFGMDMDLPEDYDRLEEYVKRTKLGQTI